MQKIIVGSDHVGYPLKQAVLQHLIASGYEVMDAGPDTALVPVDYPDYAQRVASAVVSGEFDYGVVICGSGIGVSIAANKVPGARAALCFDAFTAHLARAHNDANILAMGVWVVTPERALGILDEWLKTPFEQGRHVPRVAKLNLGQVSPDQSLPVYPPTFYQTGVSISLKPTLFGPVLFSGRLEEGLSAVVSHGLKFIELSVRHSQDIQIDHLAELLNQYGLKLSAIATGQGCIHDDLCLSATEPDLRAMAIQRIQALAEVAARFRTRLIIGGVRGRLSGPPEAQREQRRLAVDAIRQCVRFASELGVTTLLEPINRYETNFVINVAEGLDLLDEVGEPCFQLLLDTFHMNIEEADINAALHLAGDRLGYLHVADSNRWAPGCGHTNFQGIFDTLTKVGASIPVIAEILPLPDDRTALQRTSNFFNHLNEMRRDHHVCD